MSPSLTLGIGRIQSGDPVILHKLRQSTLHELLDSAPGISVTDWGVTDDTQPHEFTGLAIMAAGFVGSSVVLPLAKQIAQKLLDKGVDKATTQLVAWLTEKLGNKQDDRKIDNFEMTLPDGTKISCPVGVSA